MKIEPGCMLVRNDGLPYIDDLGRIAGHVIDCDPTELPDELRQDYQDRWKMPRWFRLAEVVNGLVLKVIKDPAKWRDPKSGDPVFVYSNERVYLFLSTRMILEHYVVLPPSEARSCITTGDAGVSEVGVCKE